MRTLSDQHYLEVVARLRSARERSGMTQAQLARNLGRPQSYVSKVETGERRIDFIELLRLCRALGTSLADVTPAEYRDVLEGPNTDGS